MQQANKEEFTVPVMLAIKGISTKESALDALTTAAEKTFNEIQEKLNAGLFITEATQGRFATQISNLAGLAVNQVGKFEDINKIVSSLPDGMENLNFQQLQATYSGQQLLEKLKEMLYKEYEIVTLMIPYEKGDITSMLSSNSKIINSEYLDEGTKIEIELSPLQKIKYANYIIKK